MCIYLHTHYFGASPCVNGSTYHGESYTSCSSCCLPGTGGSSNTKPPTVPPRPRLLLATVQRRPHAHISSTPVVARVAALDLRCSAGNTASAMVDTLLVAAYPLVDTLLVMRQFQATLSLEVVCLCSPCVHHLAMAPTTWSSRICDPL